ncbi:metallophosphoesterase [Lentisphaerota bacterium ZTH]|nr:metallophosphoesterase [Lentisphaerota bacterium]WET06444.1 metallophosphoesterase [Lentisphaerota bacterium ZTH]
MVSGTNFCRCVVFLLSVFIFLTCPGLRAADFWFAQITDPHVGVKYTENNAALEQVVASINKLPVDIKFVALTGDLVNNGADNVADMDLAKSILSKLNKPLYIIPGNHDIIAERAEACASSFKEYFGPLFFKKNCDNVMLYFVTLGMNNADPGIPGYQPLVKMRAAMLADPSKPKIVFQHIPPLNEWLNPNSEFGTPNQLGLWRLLISNYNVKALICGHLHRNQLMFFGKTPVYVGPATGFVGDTRQASYNIYHYRGGRLACVTVQVPDAVQSGS